MHLPLKRAVKLINFAREKETENNLYLLWLARYPLYDKKNYESFSEFYEKSKPQIIQKDIRNKDELMQEILGIK